MVILDTETINIGSRLILSLIKMFNVEGFVDNFPVTIDFHQGHIIHKSTFRIGQGVTLLPPHRHLHPQKRYRWYAPI